ncbi:MAG: transcription antitermination factor NusB [Thiomargarita sp.]|nr:transcription antitermination factor NusB [Thiomargarita sp.]
MPAKKRFSPKARSAARQCILQALYQWQLTGLNTKLIEMQFLSEEEALDNMYQADIEYFTRLLKDIPLQLKQLDTKIVPLLDRSLLQVDPIELAILRIGCYELTFCQEIPFKVVINEAVELAKKFGAAKSHKYINSILDKIAR